MLTNLIFDFDGTLFDSKHGIKIAFEDTALRVLGKNISFNSTHIGPTVSTLFDFYFETETDKKNDFIKQFRDLYDNIYCLEGVLFENVLDFLNSIHSSPRYNLNILTNKPSFALSKILEKYKIKDYFTIISPIDDQIYPVKNKTDRLKLIIKQNNIDKSKTLYIGDTKEDFNVAIENSISFIFADYGYGELNSDDKCTKIKNIIEIEKYIK